MFRYFASKSALINRIRELERNAEILTGANQVLREQLDLARVNENKFFEKLLDVLGVNHPINRNLQPVPQSPINVGKQVKTWPKVREDLETKARLEYWEKKRESQDKEIKNLEEEMNIGGEKDNGTSSGT